MSSKLKKLLEAINYHDDNNELDNCYLSKIQIEKDNTWVIIINSDNLISIDTYNKLLMCLKENFTEVNDVVLRIEVANIDNSKISLYFENIIHSLADNNSKYNGEIVPMWDGESKQKAIEELKNIYDIDLDKSYAYGDTSGDYTMFKAVGNPFAMNPTKELITKILSDEKIMDKIRVIVERKDVTYNLDKHSLNIYMD